MTIYGRNVLSATPLISDDKIFDAFLKILLNITSCQLQCFQSNTIAAKIISILAMQILVYLQAGIWSRTCRNLSKTKEEIK